MSDSDMRMMRQAMLQTWADQADAKRRRCRREWISMALVGAFCLLAVFSRSLFG